MAHQRKATFSGPPLTVPTAANPHPGDDRFYLNVPLDAEGHATFFAFPDGFAPNREALAKPDRPRPPVMSAGNPGQAPAPFGSPASPFHRWHSLNQKGR